MNKLNGILIVLIMQLTLTGCSDLFGKKVVKDTMESTRTNAGCELVMDDFSDILERPITSTINCLEKNLDIFMNISELGDGKKLSRVALVNYLARNRRDTTPKTIAVINTVFTLAHLITGDEVDYVSRANVASILELVRSFNIHAYNTYGNTFGSDSPANFSLHEKHRAKVEAAARDIQAALMKIYVPDRGEGVVHSAAIMNIIKGFINNNDDTVTKIEGVLFAKKILMGGVETEFTHRDIGFLFTHLPRLLPLILDAVRYKHLTLEQPEVMKFLQDDVNSLAYIMFHPSQGEERRNAVMFNVDVAIAGIDGFLDEDKKISKYKVLIKEAVRIFTLVKADTELMSEEEKQVVYGKDMEKIFSHVSNIANRALGIHLIYNSPNIKPLLDAPQSVVFDPTKYEAEFPLNRTDLKEFGRIINTYRYMKGSNDMAYYSLDYRRNANGVAEIASYEYLVKAFFLSYGTAQMMSSSQLMAILKKFEEPLIEMEIILPRRSRSTAETISLLGSLFQAQSNNNKDLDYYEATEFAISLVTAISAKTKLYDFYASKNCKMDEFNRIEPSCFKEHFYEAICTNYRDQLPRLFEYLGADSRLGCAEQNFNSEHNVAYTNASAEAARTCHIYPDDKSEIYYSESDFMSIFLAMMHIETTITRWDKNLNNTMDPSEVIDAWAIYKPAIIGMLPDALKKLPLKIQEFAAKLIYQYLVKFESSPNFEGKEIWKTIGNITKLIAKKAPASRKSIAAILKIVSDESKKKALAEYESRPDDPAVEKPFDCNWLRDPNNIPRD